MEMANDWQYQERFRKFSISFQRVSRSKPRHCAAAHGKRIKIDLFPILWGLRGDILSPLFLFSRIYSGSMTICTRNSGARFIMRTYANDLALTDDGDAGGIGMANVRASAIASGSRVESGMKVKIVKAKVLHVVRRKPVIVIKVLKNKYLIQRCICMRWVSVITWIHP